MKETAFKIFWVLTVCLAMVSFSACGKTSGDDDISVDEAESMMIAYLENKGFGGEDFLSESDIMKRCTFFHGGQSRVKTPTGFWECMRSPLTERSFTNTSLEETNGSRI